MDQGFGAQNDLWRHFAACGARSAGAGARGSLSALCLRAHARKRVPNARAAQGWRPSRERKRLGQEHEKLIQLKGHEVAAAPSFTDLLLVDH